jgi:orotate phosphoribosyltransferase
MNDWRILHLSDFHIAEPDDASGQEYLRKGRYPSFINELMVEVDVQLAGVTPSVVVTGDFVHKGSVDNFTHARSIVTHVANKVGVELAGIPVCIGNHDLERAHETIGEPGAARSAYRTFASSFLNGTGRLLGERGVLCGPTEDGIYFLMLDSTLGAMGKDEAGGLAVPETDQILTAVEAISDDALLVVGSHHVISHEGVSHIIPFEDSHWVDRHVWRASKPLWRSLIDRRKNGPVLWLSGDVHHPCYYMYDGHHYVVSGRLGESPSAGTQTEVPRQVSLVSVPRVVGSKCHVHVVEFHRDIDVSGAYTGRWKLRPQDGLVIQRLNSVRLHDDSAVPLPPVTETATKSHPRVESFNDDAQQLIENVIADRGLYHFGRFATSEGDVSLSWISIGRLLKESNILHIVVSGMTKWLFREVLSDKNPQDVVLVGIDCWGAVLASQVSVRTGIECICTGVRGRGRYHLPQESLDPSSVERIVAKKTVLVVSDVIATGESIRHVQATVAELQGGAMPKAQEWIGFSVLCDADPNQPRNCGGILRLVTACGSIRMPRLPYQQLPSTAILPSVITL